jgi:hypothetical protein
MVLIGKFSISLALLLLLVLSLKCDLTRLNERQFTILSWISLILLRSVVFGVFFWVLGFTAQSDVLTYYSDAKHAMRGEMIYREFVSTYGPLFTYTNGLALFLWDSPKTIVLLAILVELASFPLWLFLARLALGEDVARSSVLLYVLSPVPLFIIGVNGQNQGLCAAYLAVIVFLLTTGRNGLAGLVMGLSIPGVKFVTALFAPLMWAFANRRRIFFTACLVCPILIYGFLLLKGANITVPLQMQLNDQTSGNLPFLIGLLGANATSTITRRLFDCFLVSSLAIAFGMTVLWTRTSNASWLIHACTIVGMTFMLCSKKSYTNYLVLFYFPLCMSVAANGFSLMRATFFGMFNLVAVLEPSLYFRWILQSSGSSVPSLALIEVARSKSFYIPAIFVACDLFLVCCYFGYLVSTWRFVARERTRVVGC